MEKFTVDLDKVLDEFEFNEEQAFHQENFKNEDLPAKKYKKPHFQPINMADADFSPAIETTMQFISHNRKHSQDSTNSSTASDNIPCSCKYNDVNPVMISNLLEPSTINNFQAVAASVDKVDNKIKHVCDDLPVANLSSEDNESNFLFNEKEFENNDSDKCELKEEEKIIGEVDLNSINVDIIPEEFIDETDVTSERIVDVIPEKCAEGSHGNSETTHIKPDLIGSKCDNEENENDDTIKLPDLTDVNKEPYQDTTSNNNENFDTISNEKEASENSEQEKTTVENSNKISELTSPDLTGEGSEPQELSDVKPIQFQSDNDISDEDLHRYLEELEEEEDFKKITETEPKPMRPDFLNLNEKNKPERNGSPGLTPLPKNPDIACSETVRDENGENESKTMKSVAGGATMSESFPENNEQGETESILGVSNGNRQPVGPLTIDERRLGKVSPFWMPDHFASNCMDCDIKFTVIKRRHHCRACGRILCSKCCGMRASLEYLQNQEQRVCNSCFLTLAKVMMYELQYEGEQESSPTRRPNPNSPMEYCSTVPPPLQVSVASSLTPPSVLVPVGVLKREGTAKMKENTKQVMFSDGIRPGGDLTDLDGSADQRRAFRRPGRTSRRVGTPPGNSLSSVRMLPPIDPNNQSFIPEKGVPPVCLVNKGETIYQENWPHDKLLERLKDPSLPPLIFAVNRHLVVSLKIEKLDCCMNKTCWIFSTKGMECVGQDEILILLALKDDGDDIIPRDIFLQLHCIYQEAAKGNTITELDCWCVLESNFLDSPQHGGFLFIRPTFQCLNRIDLPPPPFLVGILLHRSEIPWARVFPIRLMLRLGVEFRYFYPCPLLSVRFRDPVYYDIGHTIIKLLADFRSLSYTLANVRGLKIHVEAKQASIFIPRNRYDQIVRALNNSNEPVLALAGNFSQEADAHFVCIQTEGDEITYTTQTINIRDGPPKVTGASFVVLNGALKSGSGLSAKKSIVEDGLLVQVPNETMTVLRNKLRNMEDWSVKCGPVEGDGGDETVKIVWCEDDKNFNVGVKSVIDNLALDGIPSIRTHNFADCMGSMKFIRWTQVFIIKCEDGATSAKVGDPLEVKKISENIARATCTALKKLLDLLAASGITVLAVRATIDQDNVGYEAGSNGEKLPPIYMNSLDNELIPVLHKAAFTSDSVAVLELVFHIMDQ